MLKYQTMINQKSTSKFFPKPIASISAIMTFAYIVALVGVSSFSLSKNVGHPMKSKIYSKKNLPSLFSSKNSFDNMPMHTPEEIEQNKRKNDFREDRVIPFDCIENARDLSSIGHSPVKPGRILRMGKVSNASDKDADILLNELKIKTLVDLRSRTELKDDTTLNNENIVKNYTTIVWSERDDSNKELPDGWVRNWLKGTKAHFTGNEERKERHFVSIMDQMKYAKGTLSKLRKRDIAVALVKDQVSGVKEVFLTEINEGGLPMMNDLLLKMGSQGIKRVLEIIADKTRHPIAFYCTAGKDRTGLISAIILSLLGVPDKDIVEDYCLSSNVYSKMGDKSATVGALNQRNLDPEKFLIAPPEVMQAILNDIKENYNSVEGYLDHIGFDEEDRKRLKDALTT